MWQQNLGASGFRPQAPNPSDWANVAAQWLENKKFYEQWQQQQYQQHMQMMAASHAAQMAQPIDPSVITEQRVLTLKRVRVNCALTVCSGGAFALVVITGCRHECTIHAVHFDYIHIDHFDHSAYFYIDHCDHLDHFYHHDHLDHSGYFYIDNFDFFKHTILIISIVIIILIIMNILIIFILSI